MQLTFTKSLSFCKHLPEKITVWTKARLTGSYVLIMPMIISKYSSRPTTILAVIV